MGIFSTGVQEMKPIQTFTLLVNSSDGYEDCWMPFFTLLKRYWPEIDVPILLNTEKTLWQFDGFEIKCTQVQKKYDRHLTWSECLQEALLQVESDIVLYMQEDYFIEEPVNHQAILSLIELMQHNPEIKHIGLTHFGSHPPFKPYSDNRLWEISQKSRYRVATQAGLWKKNTLLSLMRPWESGWMFEIFGSIRASRRKDTLLTIKRDVGRPLISYQGTGIVKGQWSQFMEPVFYRENIKVDFKKRGFYNDATPSIIRRTKLFIKLISTPLLSIKSIIR